MIFTIFICTTCLSGKKLFLKSGGSSSCAFAIHLSLRFEKTSLVHLDFRS
jgi:hypothetical protein